MRIVKEDPLKGMSPVEYEARLSAAIDKHGDVALAFNPETGEFEPGRQMLPAAEVEGKFVPQSKEEYDAYTNLGAQGGIDMRNMQKGITEDRNRFAKDYMWPAAEAALNVSSVGKGAQILYKGGKMLAKATAPIIRKQLAKQVAKKTSQLAAKKKAQGAVSASMNK